MSTENYMDKNLMKRKHVFGTHAIFIIRLLIASLFLIASAFTTAGYFSHLITGDAAFALIVAYAIVAGTTIFLVQKVLIAPYQRTRALFQKFVQNEAYRELIESQYLIFDEQQDVLLHVDSLLDQKSMIRLSTKQAELLALQNQINPHFLYNTLEAIRSDALCAGIDSIANTTEALATFFRYTITDTSNLVTVQDELDNIENYFKIQQYRFGEKFAMEVDCPDSEDILSLKMPKLTLQPFVENAIFHGLESKAEGGRIHISLDVTNNNLLISIHDNGIGVPEDKLSEINYKIEHVSMSGSNDAPEQKGGIALINVARRIKLLFGENYGFHIFSVSGLGTDVRIKIPINR